MRRGSVQIGEAKGEIPLSERIIVKANAETKLGIRMKIMNTLYLLLFFVFLRLTVAPQTRGSEIIEINQDEKISLTDIIGNWFTIDSSASKISMININNYFVEIDGIKHGVGNYSFRIYGDSISVNGSAPNWPPYNCTLKILKGNYLEIEFYQFLSNETTKVIYRR